jgi:DNA-binding NtrC family response regulator
MYPKHEMPTLDEVQRKLITQTLEYTKGKKMHAARILGIERRRFNRLLEKYGMKKNA